MSNSPEPPRTQRSDTALTVRPVGVEAFKVIAALYACLLSMLLGYSPLFGLTFGALAMAGDLVSSFVKRRRGLEPSDQSLGWDQLPESLLPSLYAVAVLDLPWWYAVSLPIAFMLVEILISKPLFRLHIRKRPY